MDTPQLIALAAALGWASGLRLYAVVFLTGLAGHFGWVQLPPGLQLLQTMPVLMASGAMLVVEFLADKIPWVDSMWDGVHTAIRIPAGAALAAGVFGWDHATAATIAALLGGTLAATAHTAKASTRAAVNTSPEPFSNLALSLAGDAMVPAALWLAWSHPWAFLVVLAVVLVLMVWLIRSLARFIKALWQRRKAGRQSAA
jgi:predicted ferric reductase